MKQAKAQAEDTKIGIRNVRRTANDEAKQLEKDGMPEDEANQLHDEVQKLTDNFTDKIDHLVEANEKDVLTV